MWCSARWQVKNDHGFDLFIFGWWVDAVCNQPDMRIGYASDLYAESSDIWPNMNNLSEVHFYWIRLLSK